ncbi:hypothetical protein QP028_05615 [Corynebacterium suedekumii]|nr:hypothetical protein QP028_05615 [Corynebacterium suedekumii]
MRRTRAAAAAVVATAALTLTACTTDSDSAQNAVAVGGTLPVPLARRADRDLLRRGRARPAPGLQR